VSGRLRRLAIARDPDGYRETVQVLVSCSMLQIHSRFEEIAMSTQSLKSVELDRPSSIVGVILQNAFVQLLFVPNDDCMASSMRI
jgi:hypothetical protein